MFPSEFSKALSKDENQVLESYKSLLELCHGTSLSNVSAKLSVQNAFSSQFSGSRCQSSTLSMNDFKLSSISLTDIYPPSCRTLSNGSRWYRSSARGSVVGA